MKILMEVIFEGLGTWQVITLEMFGLGVVESREPKGDPPSAMLLCKKRELFKFPTFPIWVEEEDSTLL